MERKKQAAHSVKYKKFNNIGKRVNINKMYNYQTNNHFISLRILLNFYSHPSTDA